MRLTRADTIRLDKDDQTYFTKEGYLVDHPVVTSTGVFEYHNDDGSPRYELRLPEEVFAPASLASYEGKPVIITHDAGYVNKDNVEDEQIGTVLSKGYKDGNNVRAKIIIHGTDDMKRSGLKELSLGYNLDLDETPGTYNGQKYDAIQRNIRINHLALVSNARAGEQARLNIDSKDRDIIKGGRGMKHVSRRDEGVMAPDELQKAIEAFQARKADRIAAKDAEEKPDDIPPVAAEEETVAVEEAAPVAEPEKVDAGFPQEEAPEEVSAEDKIKMVKDRRDRRDAEEDPEDQKALHTIAEMDEDIQTLMDVIDQMKAEKDMQSDACAKDAEEEETIEEEAFNEKMNADSLDRFVQARLAVCRVGDRLNIDGIDKMPLMEARKAVIKKVKPALNLDGKSKVYIKAAYDMAVAEIGGKKSTDYQMAQMTRTDSAPARKSGAFDARARMIARIEGGND